MAAGSKSASLGDLSPCSSSTSLGHDNSLPLSTEVSLDSAVSSCRTSTQDPSAPARPSYDGPQEGQPAVDDQGRLCFWQ
jgi:hypothetical protein